MIFPIYRKIWAGVLTHSWVLKKLVILGGGEQSKLMKFASMLCNDINENELRGSRLFPAVYRWQSESRLSP